MDFVLFYLVINIKNESKISFNKNTLKLRLAHVISLHAQIIDWFIIEQVIPISVIISGFIKTSIQVITKYFPIL